MALATRCPACSTVFRISTGQATAKGGTVRCGQCRHVFNALDALVRVEDLEVIEEVQVAAAPTSDADGQPPSRAVADVASASDEGPASDEGLTGDAAVEAGRSALEADESGSEAAHPAAEPVTPPATESVTASATESATDRAVEPVAESAGEPHDAPSEGPDDRPRVTSEWWLPDPADRPAAEPFPDPLAADGPTTDHREDAGRVLSGRRTDLQAADAELGPSFLAGEAPPNPLGRSARWTLGVLSLVALIVLVAQLAYLWRDEIAVRWSSARPWLTAACVPLRCQVGYPAHLDWITIESATIQTAGVGLDVYVLNALLRNRASSDVRYPHLELVLTDLEDRPILRRALRPEDYLPPGRLAARTATSSSDDAAARSGFPANSELPIRLTFELGDLRFAGYRVDKFYP